MGNVKSSGHMALLFWAAASVPVPAIAQGVGVAPPVVPATTEATPLAAPARPDGEYILGPEDTIEIEIVGRADKTRAKIYADGTIQMNLIGQISASGKTTRQLGDEIAQALKSGGFYANPIINVEVVNYASRYVTVLGAVATPGLVPIDRPYRLSELLARVGGVRDTGADYVIVRPDKGEEHRYKITELATGGEDKDPYVLPGAKIFSPTADLFYISGQVNSPGSYPLVSGLTISQAIARGGGLSQSGSERRVQVTRKGEKVKLDSNSKVEAGDVIVVGERLF